MFAKILFFLTSRRYENVQALDLFYLARKGFFPRVRGLAACIFLMRLVPSFMLGANVRFLVPRKTQIGSGVFIGGNSYIELYSNMPSIIGNSVTIREGAWVQCRSGLNSCAEKLTIGDGVYIGPSAVIGVGGQVMIGDHCNIGARLAISAEEHVNAGGSYVSGSVHRKGVGIGKNCWLGNNVTILDGVSIGENCVIGACSLVTRDIPNNSVAFGSPARVIRRVTA